MTTRRLAALLLIAAAAFSLTISSPTAGAPVPGNIETFAGSDAGDGGPATNATLNEPESIAVTSTGDLYVMDSNPCRIRKVSGGIITNVAGNGACEYSADGSVAASSAILPTAIAAGPGGVLYFTEASGASGPVTDSCRVRKVVGGLITTVGGNGTCGSPVNGAGATATPLPYPTMLAVDGSGRAYVSGISDCRVWKIVPGGVVTHVAGDKCGVLFDANPLAAWITPVSIAVDSTGANIYVAENNYWSQCYIVRVTGGVLSLFAGAGTCGFDPDGPVAGARIEPIDIEVGSTGDVFFVDGCSARKISGVTLSTVATCVAGPTPYLVGLGPVRIAVRGTGEIWMGDIQNCRVAHLNGSAVEIVAGGPDCYAVGDGSAAVYATLSSPQAVGVDAAENVYIADRSHNRVRKVAAGNISTMAGSSTVPPGYPPIGEGVPATEGAVSPRVMAVTPGGDVYLMDENGCRLRVVSGAMITTIAGSGGCGMTIGDGMAVGAVQFFDMTGVGVSTGGVVYVSDQCRIWSVDAGVVHLVAGDGTCATSPDGPAGSSSLNNPFGLAIRGGEVYVAERGSCRVRKVSGGSITTIAGDPSGASCGYAGDGGAATGALLNEPTNLAFDRNGALYVGDMGNCRVRKVQGGVITTVAGNGVCGFGGDGGPAILAKFAHPTPWVPAMEFLGVALAASGDLYIADPGNERVRVVYSRDSDGDGCESSKEPSLVPPTDPSNPWDFYSVPVPALYQAPDPTTVFRDNNVSASDAQAVFSYFKNAFNAGSTEYEQDLNLNGIKDGWEYDRTYAGSGKTGPPDGIIAASDAQLAFAQFKFAYAC